LLTNFLIRTRVAQNQVMAAKPPVQGAQAAQSSSAPPSEAAIGQPLAVSADSGAGSAELRMAGGEAGLASGAPAAGVDHTEVPFGPLAGATDTDVEGGAAMTTSASLQDAGVYRPGKAAENTPEAADPADTNRRPSRSPRVRRGGDATSGHSSTGGGSAYSASHGWRRQSCQRTS
jgi:hypothetical protein